MPDLDEYLRNELRRSVAPVDVNDVSSRIDRRRTRRSRLRKAQSVALTVVVLAGTIGGVAVLSSVFRKGSPAPIGDTSPFPIVPKANGVIVAAQQARGGPLQLVSMNPDGSDRQVIQTRATGDPWLPAWSPDGTRLAVAVFPDPEPRAIWVMDADGANAVKIAEGDDVSRPSWSPDGTEIAYAIDGKQGSSIHIVNADGSGDRMIGDAIQGKDYFSASFSPDGTHIVYDKGTDSGFGIFVMNADGSDLLRISTGPSDYNPSWSPDGTRVVFTRQEQGAESDIYVMDVDGSNESRLTSNGPGVTNLNPEWSPDGTEIAYVAGVTGGPGSLVVMNTDGSQPVTILDGGVIGISWQPLTAPDGPTDLPGLDIGLDFRLCRANRLSGVDMLGNGTAGSAWTGVRLKPDGSCPSEFEGFNVVAVDHTGDGLADSWWGPMQYCVGCKPFDATDLNGDGSEELVVLAQWGTTPQYLLFSIQVGPGKEPKVRPILVASPGHPQAGFRPGEPVALWTGGDEGFSASVRCEGYPGTPILVATWSDHPIDGPGSETKEVHETRLRLESDGLMHAVDSSDSTRPTSDPGPATWTGPACGVRFWPAF
ncbi:MAG: LpqB family beta-propeller domain-containing protein [Actinomycetota bacterium]